MNEEARKTPPQNRNPIPLLATRCPAPIWSYLSWIQRHPSLGVSTMREFMSLSAVEWFETEPWAHGWKLKKALSLAEAPRMAGGGRADVVQVNVLFSDVVFSDGRIVSGTELRDMFKTTAKWLDEHEYRAARIIRSEGKTKEVDGKVSMSTLCWNYLLWLALVKYPVGATLSPVPRHRAVSPAASLNAGAAEKEKPHG